MLKRARLSTLQVTRDLKTIALESAFLLIYAIMIEDPMTSYMEKFTMNDVRLVFRRVDNEYKNTKVHDLLRKVVQEYEIKMNQVIESDPRNGTDRHGELFLDFGMATSIYTITLNMVHYDVLKDNQLRQPPKLKPDYGVEQVPIDDPNTRNSHLIWRFTKEKLNELKDRYESGIKDRYQSDMLPSTTTTPFTLPDHVINPKSSIKKKQNE